MDATPWGPSAVVLLVLLYLPHGTYGHMSDQDISYDLITLSLVTLKAGLTDELLMIAMARIDTTIDEEDIGLRRYLGLYEHSN